MLETLQRFVVELRRAGLRISPAEVIDAGRAAREVGLERRDLFRAALRSTLSKTREDSARFEQVFDRFFSVPAARVARSDRQPRGGGMGSAGRSAIPETELRRRPGRLRVLTASRPEPDEPRRPGRQVAAPPRLNRRAAGPARAAPRPRPSPRQRPAALLTPAEARRLDLSGRLTSAEEELVAREVPRMIRQVRLRLGRRYRRGPTGRLWAARLLRENVGTEGVPFVIPRRTRRPRRPRVVVLVDVSWSVMRASSVFLAMAREFLRSDASVTIYFFVDRCVEVTDIVRRWPGPARLTFARFLEGIPDLDPKAASDYGRAFYQAARLRRGGLRGAGRNSVLVVLGDARGNERDPQAWAFEDLAGRFRRVIWLDPERVSRWNTGDSALHAYLPSCDVVCEARDLQGIARGVAEVARSLGARAGWA